MKELKVKLAGIEEIREFNHLVSKYEGDVDLISGRYIVDAKSIVGIFSLDLSKEMTMQVYGDNPDDLISAVQQFII